MAKSPIRVATAALSGRIFAGRANAAGDRLYEPRYDVTNDVYAAIRDHVGLDHEMTLSREGEPSFTIRIVSVKDAAQSPLSASSQGADQ